MTRPNRHRSPSVPALPAEAVRTRGAGGKRRLRSGVWGRSGGGREVEGDSGRSPGEPFPARNSAGQPCPSGKRAGNLRTTMGCSGDCVRTGGALIQGIRRGRTRIAGAGDAWSLPWRDVSHGQDRAATARRRRPRRNRRRQKPASGPAVARLAVCLLRRSRRLGACRTTFPQIPCREIYHVDRFYKWARRSMLPDPEAHFLRDSSH